jgi:hypothetical protein
MGTPGASTVSPPKIELTEEEIKWLNLYGFIPLGFQERQEPNMKTKKSSVKSVKSKKGGKGVSGMRFKPSRSKSGGSKY